MQKLDSKLPIPYQSYPGDGAVDLHAAEDANLLYPGRRYIMPTGISIAIPPGYAGFITPRSGVSSYKGLGIANSPGLIDSGYRGEIKVILVNNSENQLCSVKRGDKIAQLTITPVFARTCMKLMSCQRL